ncbi:MAG: 3-deoxy-D-manno-octulosonic acid transferase [Parvibaculum sedimenti]|uniref:3-deoxy-D-manno-octulosonic acid transferase n=1 Tax=Parvibaculum sedimenti TaxID=2608632 RepID=UPI003BB5961B
MTTGKDMTTGRSHRSESAGLGLAAYRLATRALGPALPLLLALRMRRGKEDASRLAERCGIPSLDRPDGKLVWIHAASVGESLSVLPLIDRLIAANLHVLITTGTVTSAHLMGERLPEGAIHQFAALDHPDYAARFLDHWKPDLAVWVESEFWPNLIVATHERGIPLALINARITQRSFEGWQRFPRFIANLLDRFSLLLAQDEASARRLEGLSAHMVGIPGNLKHDAAPLTADEKELAALRAAIDARPIWIATNTHEGEEKAAADAHQALASSHPGLLTLIVPRHPARGTAIAAELKKRGFNVAQRSLGEAISLATDIYLADTLGELGLFYRLADIAFIGGTLTNTGGHNPFEPARLHSALIAGPSDFNFSESYASFEKADALIRIEDASTLAKAVARLLDDAAERTRRSDAAEIIASTSSGATDRTVSALRALLKTPATGGSDA